MTKIEGKKYGKNARKIDQKKKDKLKIWLEKFGDLSGIILNVRNGEYVAGNQRSDVLRDGELVISERFDKPDAVGTVCYGYIDYEGQRFSYREVDWSEELHAEASIVANQHVAEWDDAMLMLHHKDILEDVGFSLKEIAEMERATAIPSDEPITEAIYPIVQKFSEKYGAIIITFDNEIDENFLKQVLGLETEKSYKNENLATSFVISAQKFIKFWNKKD